MRKVFSVALMAAMVCLVGMSKDASANVTYSLIWQSATGGATGVGTANLGNFTAGNTAVLGIVLTNDQTLGGHGVDLTFDTALGNELNLFAPTAGKEWAGSNYGTTTMATNYSPINSGFGPPAPVESTGAVQGSVTLIESGQITGPLFLPVGTYTVGTVKFVSNGSAQSDVNVGYFGLSGGTLGNNFLLIPNGNISFNGATVNIPEPGTVSLLGLGLVGLVLAGRRRARR